jgi:hypothetical protein
MCTRSRLCRPAASLAARLISDAAEVVAAFYPPSSALACLNASGRVCGCGTMGARNTCRMLRAAFTSRFHRDLQLVHQRTP